MVNVRINKKYLSIMKPILISLKDLDEKPCRKYYDYIIKKYGNNGLFKPLEIFDELNGDYADVSWLIKNCEKYQTKEMLDYYKSLNPDYENVSWLIKKCEFCQTQEMLDYYKSLNPVYKNVSLLIANCEYCQTQEMLDFYKLLKP